MVNVKVLKEHIQKYKITPQTAGEFHKQLFALYPETAQYFDAEDIDPDSIPKSRKFQQLGVAAIKEIFSLPLEFEKGVNFGGTAKDMAEFYKEQGLSYDDFKKIPNAVIKMMEAQAGGCTDEQKKEWMNIFSEVFKVIDEKGY